jgi:hypothetical protein
VRLARSIVGIYRALNALEDLGTSDLEREAEASEAADRKRWMQFLRKALGHEDDGHGSHGRRGSESGSGRGRGGGL